MSELDQVKPPVYDRDLNGPAVMHPDAARAMSAMLFTAEQEGHDDLALILSYRTYAKQWDKWWDYQNGGNLAAYPGTSNHGWAVAGDMGWRETSTIQWAHAEAGRFGFKFDVPSESWHMTYQDGDIRPAVLEAERQMAKIDEVEQRVDQIEKGFQSYLDDKEVKQEGLARKVWRSLTKAAKVIP
jgi:hypothetical protein